MARLDEAAADAAAAIEGGTADAVRDFVHCPPMELLIVSYEASGRTQTLEKANLKLLVCDEGHRLKSGSSKTSKALVAQRHAKRVVLSGTPVQNELRVGHMADFACPGVSATSPRSARFGRRRWRRGASRAPTKTCSASARRAPPSSSAKRRRSCR